MKFLHTMIRVKDIEASLKFYTEVLDMEFDHKKRLEDCWLYFLSDKEKTCQLELTVNDETQGVNEGGWNIDQQTGKNIEKDGYDLGSGFGHFAFAVESLDDFTEKLATLGYDYIYPPFDLNGKGTKIAFIKDPDGYEIELIEKVVW